MVRTLQPTSEGIPVEIYCFTKATDWIPYETFQSALFDHIIAILPRFGLRIYQRPGGHGLPEKSGRKSVMRPCRGNNNPAIIWYSGFISVPL